MKNVKDNVREILGLVRENVRCMKSVTENELMTGYSFFEGKDRLLKVMKTQGELMEIEFNVKPSEYWEGTQGFVFIEHGKAIKKKLGTCKAVLKTRDIDIAKALVLEVIDLFQNKEYRKIW